ncbi:hypothetical protein MMC07_004202 [Pseudocyphellaria aurata]|nr:hypothetical protein [Pseudocyphellaria aurata]
METGSKHPGVLHHYSRRLVAFEHGQTGASPSNTIIFIGGLTDGLLTVPYTLPLAKALPNAYSLVEVLLSSSYSGWGTVSINQDVKEIAQCVAYFQNLRPQGKVVLLGHSTGCQDVLHYLIADGERPRIDGGILHSSVSDREALTKVLPPADYENGVKLAREYVDDNRGGDVLPARFTGALFSTPISANRWMSLASPGPDHAGEDDYFSSDFDDERLKRTFGKAGATGTRLSLLYGGSDQYVPDAVDKGALLGKWFRHIQEAGGVVDESAGIIEGATHTLKEGGKPTEDLIDRVIGFISRL